MSAATRERDPRRDRDNPLRDLLDEAMTTGTAPKASAVRTLPLREEITDTQGRRIHRAVSEWAMEIADAMEGGENAQARRLIVEAMDELGEYFDPDAQREDPRALAEQVPRGGAPTRMTRVDALRDDVARVR